MELMIFLFDDALCFFNVNKIIFFLLKLFTAIRLIANQGIKHFFLMFVDMLLIFHKPFKTLPTTFMLAFIPLKLKLGLSPLKNLSLFLTIPLPIFLIILLSCLIHFSILSHNIFFSGSESSKY